MDKGIGVICKGELEVKELSFPVSKLSGLTKNDSLLRLASKAIDKVYVYPRGLEKELINISTTVVFYWDKVDEELKELIEYAKNQGVSGEVYLI